MTTYLQTLMHFVKGIIGAGIFSMGVAFKNAGMIVALIITPIMGIIVCHCATILVRLLEYVEATELEEQTDVQDQKSGGIIHSNRSNRSYADVSEKVFRRGGPTAKKMAKGVKLLVNIGLCTMTLGYCCAYVVFLGSNMEKALLFFGIKIEMHLIMLICIVPMWLLSLITRLEVLAPFSTIANVLLLGIIVATLYYICQDLPKFSSTKYVGNIENFPLFIGISLYTYECIAMIAPLRDAMDKPEKIAGTFGILNVGFLMIIPFVVMMGALAYLRYGEEISGTVFLNLPETIPVEVLIMLVCLLVILTYPVQMYVPVAIIWPMITNRYGPFKRPLLSLRCFRTLLVIFTLLIGQIIPFIDLIMSLIGAVGSTALTLFLPPFMEMVIFYPVEKSRLKKTFQVTKNSFLFVLAVVIFISGIYASIRDIIASFKNTT